MKKIISGKLYDTDTAKEVGFYSTGLGWSDFRHFEETLYQKKTGEFFLYGKGGPKTRYAVSIIHNQWETGEKIIPLDYEAAKKWGEENLSADEYEALFGEVAEDDSRTRINLSVSVSVAEKIRRTAAEQGISLAAYIESLVEGASK